jgi:DNA polymerase-4
MSTARARALCPEAVVVAPRMEAYSAASRAVFAIFHDTTPHVEGLSIDEAFLEVGGLLRIAGTPEQIAVQLRERVRAEVGLTISVGVARTKFLAKVASAVCKPDGLLIVEPDSEEAFLHPLPVERLWGVGAVTAKKLHSRGIHTVGQLAELEAETAELLLGKAAGAHLHALARLRDPRPVEDTKRRSSIGSQRALGNRPRTLDELALIVTQIMDGLAKRLRERESSCSTVVVRMRFGDYTNATRSRTLGAPTDRTEVLLGAAHTLHKSVASEVSERGATLVGVSLAGLVRSGEVQPELALDWHDGARIDSALDAIRNRFGAAAVTRAALLGREPGLSAPRLPEHE